MSIAAGCFLAIEARLQLFDSSAGQHQRVMLQDVVDVGAGGRQHADLRQVARGEREAVLDRIAVDHQSGLAEADLREIGGERLGLAVLDGEAVHDDQRARLGVAAERHLQAQRADLLVQRRVEVAAARAVRLTTTAEHRRAAIAVTGGTAALLATVLLARAGDVGALARAACRGTTLFELPGNDAVQDVGARIEAEDLVVELDVRGLRLGVEGLNLDLRVQPSWPSAASGASTVSAGGSAGALLLFAAAFRPAGYGASAWRATFTASLTISQPPFEPGTEPFTKIRPRSTSVPTISRFCWVRFLSPIWPAIFLFLKTLPGSWR